MFIREMRVCTYFITGSASTKKYTCFKGNSDGTTKTTFNFKRNQGNQCEVEERIKNPNQQEFAKISVNDCSWVPKCYSAGPSKKFWEVLKTVICLLPVILVWKIMGKYLKAVTNVKPVIFSSNTQISKTCYSLS